MDGRVWVIIVAGGSGQRFGRPKQFEKLGGQLVVQWAIARARSVADEIVVVLPKEEVQSPTFHFDDVQVVPGGETRAASVRAGLDVVPQGVDIVVVHDAARPCASERLFEMVVHAVRDGADGAVPALALFDTVKEVDGNRVVATFDRSRLVRVQTPQAFSTKALRAAHQKNDDATDDAALVERSGGLVVVVEGEETNIKVTSTDHLDQLELWLSANEPSAEHDIN